MAWKWYNGRVVDIVDLTPNTKSFWLQMEDPTTFNYLPGQFITLDLPIHEKRHKRWRSYSIANLPLDHGLIELCVVNVENGLATQYLFNDITRGDIIRFKGPGGNFILTDPMIEKELIMVCTGTGVAPFRSMLLDLVAKDAFKQKIHLIFGARKPEDILYGEEFQKLAAEEPNFKYSVTLSRAPNWGGKEGYVHKIYKRKYAEIQEDRLFLLCGWSQMIDEAVETLVLGMGYDKSQIKYELYG